MPKAVTFRQISTGSLSIPELWIHCLLDREAQLAVEQDIHLPIRDRCQCLICQGEHSLWNCMMAVLLRMAVADRPELLPAFAKRHPSAQVQGVHIRKTRSKFNLHRMTISRVQQYLRQGHHTQLRKVKQHNQSRNMFRSLSLTP